MSKIGHLVTDPKAGAYCQVTLDTGDKLLVSHDKASLTSGTLAVAQVKWFGFGSGATLFQCDLASPEGQRVLAELARWAGPRTMPPLTALAERIKSCGSLEEVRAAGESLRRGGPGV